MPKPKIALFGGSFDPVHKGHLSVATYAQHELDLDQIIFIPCAQSPHKPEHNYTDDTHRLAMLELAIQGLSWAQISDYELKAPTPSYSLHTIRHFQSEYPEAELYWILGSDQWDKLDTWYEHQRILKLVNFIIYPRVEKIERAEKNDKSNYNSTPPFKVNDLSLEAQPIYLDQASYLPISSTLIRKNLNLEHSKMNEQVYQYALKHQLYL